MYEYVGGKSVCMRERELTYAGMHVEVRATFRILGVSFHLVEAGVSGFFTRSF